MNTVLLRGTLSRDPEERSLPSGSVLVAYEVTTRDADGAASTVPVSWFDPPGRRAACAGGDEVVVVGSVRRRFFRAGGVTASRTEVVSAEVLPAVRAQRARTSVERAIAAVTASVTAWV